MARLFKITGLFYNNKMLLKKRVGPENPARQMDLVLALDRIFLIFGYFSSRKSARSNKRSFYKKVLFTILTGLVLLLLAPVRSYAQQDAIARYFSEYAEADGFTSVYISARMFRLMAQLDKDSTDQSFQRAMNQLGGLRILAADSVEGLMHYETVMSKLLVNNYEELMRVHDDDGEMIFLIQENQAGKITELLMLTGGLKSFFMLSIIGSDIDLDMVSQIGQSVNVEGMDKLGELEKR